MAHVVWGPGTAISLLDCQILKELLGTALSLLDCQILKELLTRFRVLFAL